MQKKIDFLSLLKTMAKIRLTEEYIAKRYPEQDMKCPTHLCVGQEAIPAVFGYIAKPQDIFMGTYRSHGHYLAKGGSIKAMFAELLGKPAGCSKGFGGSMHLIDTENNIMGTSAIVASGVAITAGAALSLKYRKQRAAAIAFFGDAALEEGILYETVNFALLHKLPLLMVCENNGLAVNTPLAQRQASTDLYNRFKSMGMQGKKVKENDVKNLVKTAEEEIAYVRAGKGPAFIECQVSRWSVHVGHAIQGPVDLWWQNPLSAKASPCPLARMVRYLLKEGRITKEKVKALRDTIQKQVEKAYEEARHLPSFGKTDLRQHVYSSPLLSPLPSKRQTKMAFQEFTAKTPSKLVNPF